MMRNSETLDIRKSAATERIIRMKVLTRKRVKQFLNESSIFGSLYADESGQSPG